MAHEITKTYRLPASVDRVWQALTDAKDLSAWQEDECTSDLKVGGTTSQFGGWMEGTYQIIDAPIHLRYTWRVPDWGENAEDSVVDLTLTKISDSETEVTLAHTNLPSEEERKNHEHGWDGFYFSPLKNWLSEHGK